jgi:integrase
MGDAKQRRAKGEGSLRQRGRVWYARFAVEGRTIEESTGETSRAKAATWLRHRLEEVRHGGIAAVRAGGVTLSDLRELVRADYKLKGNKRPDIMEQSVARLMHHLGDVTADALRYDRLARYANARLEAGAGRGTVRNELAMLRRMMRLAHRRGLVPSVPDMPMPAEAPPRQGFLERHELEAILAHMPDGYAPAIRFAYLTGWRFASEVRTLEWSHVDTRRGLVILPDANSKNGEGRTLPYRAHPELQEILEEAGKVRTLLEDGTRRIVPRIFHRRGEMLSDKYHRAWRRACKLAKLPGTLVHDLRRSSTRNLSEAGVAAEVIMQIQGHKTRQMFDRYRIVPTADQENALAKLAAANVGGAEAPRHHIGPAS